MNIQEKSSVPVSHETRERINHLKYDFQALYKRELSQDDIIKFLLDCYEAVKDDGKTCGAIKKKLAGRAIKGDKG